MKKINVLSVAAGLLILGSAMFAQTADEVMKTSCNLPVPDYSSCVLLMDIIDKSGTVLEHRIINQNGNRKNGITQIPVFFRLRSLTAKMTNGSSFHLLKQHVVSLLQNARSHS